MKNKTYLLLFMKQLSTYVNGISTWNTWQTRRQTLPIVNFHIQSKMIDTKRILIILFLYFCCLVNECESMSSVFMRLLSLHTTRGSREPIWFIGNGWIGLVIWNGFWADEYYFLSTGENAYSKLAFWCTLCISKVLCDHK